MIEIGGFVETSIADGPYIRSVLFLQGCSIRCKNCHNRTLWEKGSGTMFNIEDAIAFIDKHCYNKKITISGGEPLEQVDALKKLILSLRKKNYDICLYTSFLEVPIEIMRNINYLKLGSYNDDKKMKKYAFYGSSNQKMIEIFSNEGRIICKEI